MNKEAQNKHTKTLNLHKVYKEAKSLTAPLNWTLFGIVSIKLHKTLFCVDT